MTIAVVLLLYSLVVTGQTNDFCSELSDDCTSRRESNIWTNSEDSAPFCRNLTSNPILTQETQTWQPVRMRDIMVFSAFMERRLSADGLSVRIVGSGLQEEFNFIGHLYCQLWYEDMELPTFVNAKYVRIYPSILHADMWVAHFIICPLGGLPATNGANSIPYAVSVAVEPCMSAGNVLMILHRDTVEKKNTHALCLPPLYGNFQNWTVLIEMFELHRLLGVAEIVIYSQSMGKKSKEVLQEYDGNGVTVVEWKFPMLKSSVNCQRAALNDCLYRAGHVHRYVTITDLDEVLVPRVSSTWPDLMKKIASPRYGAYLFQHVYFRRNNTGEQPYLITQQSTWRTDKPDPPGKIRCKSMYDSDKAISLDLHFPYEMVQGAHEYILDPHEGLLHHYRISPMETFRKHPERYHFIEDRHMHRYKERLTQAYEERAKGFL